MKEAADRMQRLTLVTALWWLRVAAPSPAPSASTPTDAALSPISLRVKEGVFVRGDARNNNPVPLLLLLVLLSLLHSFRSL